MLSKTFRLFKVSILSASAGVDKRPNISVLALGTGFLSYTFISDVIFLGDIDEPLFLKQGDNFSR